MTRIYPQKGGMYESFLIYTELTYLNGLMNVYMGYSLYGDQI